MVRVYGVLPHHAGFGMYQRGCEGHRFPDLNSLDEYVNFVLSECPALELCEEDDPDYDTVEDANGCIYDQNGGELIGWRDANGHIGLELVYVGQDQGATNEPEEGDHVA